MAALTPVPRMSANRVVGSAYAFESSVAEESLTMALRWTFRPRREHEAWIKSPRSWPRRPWAARKPLPIPWRSPDRRDVCLRRAGQVTFIMK